MMLSGIMELPSNTRGIGVEAEVVLMTAEEYGRLSAELDEARADVAHFRQLYLDAINRQASCCRSITRNAQVAARRIHEIRVRLLHAEAERDEARADAERLRALLPPEELLERARELDERLCVMVRPPALPEGPEARSTCGRLTAPFSVTAADYPYHVGDDSPAPEEPESAPEAPAPVVEPMVPRAALEWLAERAGGKFNDCPVGATGDYEMLPADWCQERMVQYDGETAEQECKQGRGECAVADCWVQSALAAVEESAP